MTDDGWLLAQRARIESIAAEIQGMVALNQYRIARDETIAYGEERFMELAKELEGIHDLIMRYR